MNRPTINTYYDLHLDRTDIDAGRHRDAVGGLWEEIGLLQYHFLLERGLRPDTFFRGKLKQPPHNQLILNVKQALIKQALTR